MNFRTLSSTELSRLCVDAGNAEAWREFIGRFHKIIAVTVLRVARQWGSDSSALVDDLTQEAYLRLCAEQCRLLRNFAAAPGSEDNLGALLRVIAANVTHDYFRTRSAAKRGGSLRNAFAELPDEEILSDLWTGADQVEREVQIREIERALSTAPDSEVTVRERLIFRLYFRQGLTANAIAAIPALKLTTKGVESAIHRTTRYLRDQFSAEGAPPEIPIKDRGEKDPGHPGGISTDV